MSDLCHVCIHRFAYVHYKDIKTAQKAYQEKYFDPAEPVAVNDKEVSVLAIFDSKNGEYDLL